MSNLLQFSMNFMGILTKPVSKYVADDFYLAGIMEKQPRYHRGEGPRARVREIKDLGRAPPGRGSRQGAAWRRYLVLVPLKWELKPPAGHVRALRN